MLFSRELKNQETASGVELAVDKPRTTAYSAVSLRRA
jgi:hypothetical protein